MANYYHIDKDGLDLKKRLVELINHTQNLDITRYGTNTLTKTSTYNKQIRPFPESRYIIDGERNTSIEFDCVFDTSLTRFITEVKFKGWFYMNTKQEPVVRYPDLELFDNLRNRYLKLQYEKNKKEIENEINNAHMILNKFHSK